MNVSDILIIGSILAGLAAIPFSASMITKDAGPLGAIILNDSENIPGQLTRSLTGDEFQQKFKTPFGDYSITFTSDQIEEKLISPDRKVNIIQTPSIKQWILTTSDKILNITQTATKTKEEFASPYGRIEKTKEMGNVHETVEGDSSRVEEDYQEARELMESETEKMEEIRSKYVHIPGTEENETSVPMNETSVVINEFSSNGTSDWIELYNPTSRNISLDGWTIEDDKANPKSLDGKIVPEGSYLVLNKTEGDFGFGLNQGSDIIVLKKNEEIIDQVVYGNYNDGNIADNVPAPDKGESAGRSPDGSENWRTFSTPTPGASNPYQNN